MSDLGPPPDGDVNKGPMLKAITWTEGSVALALVLARVLTRTRLIKQWGWDDAFICLAIVRVYLVMCFYSPGLFSSVSCIYTEIRACSSNT